MTRRPGVQARRLVASLAALANVYDSPKFRAIVRRGPTAGRIEEGSGRGHYTCLGPTLRRFRVRLLPRLLYGFSALTAPAPQIGRREH
jgi:hypothetical protein